MRTRSARYYRKNPLSTPELVIGGLVGAAVLGIGGYLIYQKYGTPALAAAPASAISPPALAAGSTPGQAGISSLTQGPDYGPGGYVTPAPVAGA